MPFFQGTTAAITEGTSEYGHTFGGPPAHRGTKLVHPWDDGEDAHAFLLYRLNLEDPGLEIEVEGITWLPLYYPVSLDYDDYAYRIISDDEIQVLIQASDSFPVESECIDVRTPSPRPVKVDAFSLEQRQALRDYHAARDDVDRWNDPAPESIAHFGYPFTQFGGEQCMEQETPCHPCPDGNCSNHCSEIICTVWDRPVKGVRLFADYEDEGENDFVLYVFELCRNCRTVYVSNQCD